MDGFHDILNRGPFDTWWPYIIGLVVGISVVIRNYMGGQECPNQVRMDNKVVVITGGTGGIGLETTKELCRRGAKVIICARDTLQGEVEVLTIRKIIPKAVVMLKTMDLCDNASVREFAKEMRSTYDHIDVLINNAGITFNPSTVTKDGFECHMATNYLGHFLLTHELLPLLRKSQQGRIVNVSAHAYANGNIDLEDPIGTPGQRTNKEEFANSKMALVLMTKHMQHLLQDTNVTINVLTPGLVRGTRHMRHSPVFSSIMIKLSVYPWMWLLLKNPKQGAQTSVYLATDPRLKRVSGKYFNDCKVEDTADIVNDVKLAQAVYDATCEKLQVAPLTVN